VRVLMNLNSLTTPHLTGIGTYITQLCKGLRQEQDLQLLGALKISRWGQRRQVYRHLSLPVVMEEVALLAPWAFEIYHGPDFRIPKTKRLKKVVTVHDFVTFQSGLVDPRFEKAGQEELNLVLRRNLPDWVIVNSNWTKTELLKFYPEFEDRISTTLLGCDHLPNLQTLTSQAKESWPHQVLPLGQPYFLFVGTLEERKNLRRILASFLKFRENNPDFKLVLIGNRGYQGEEFFKQIQAQPTAFVYPGFTDWGDLQKLYANARALFFPSLYEGFGIPIIEAMRLGCPVITSKRGVMTEIGSGAAHLVDPEKEAELVHSLELLGRDESLRRTLVNQGITRSEFFSWQKCARETFKAYGSVL